MLNNKSLSLLFLLLLGLVVGEPRPPLTGKPPIPDILGIVQCFSDASPGDPITIEVYSNWSPIGARRYLHLVKLGYYNNSPMFRVVKRPGGPGSIVQFGISLDKELEKEWQNKNIPDDPNLGFPFERGYIAYGGGGYNSRSSQIFIAYTAERTRHLGHVPWETPFAKVVEGMEVVDKFYCGNETLNMDMPPWGKGPPMGRIKQEGLPFLKREYPLLSYLTTCDVIEEYEDPMPELHKHVIGKAEWRPMDKKKQGTNKKQEEKKQQKQEESKKFREEMDQLRGQLRGIDRKNKAWKERLEERAEEKVTGFGRRDFERGRRRVYDW